MQNLTLWFSGGQRHETSRSSQETLEFLQRDQHTPALWHKGIREFQQLRLVEASISKHQRAADLGYCSGKELGFSGSQPVSHRVWKHTSPLTFVCFLFSFPCCVCGGGLLKTSNMLGNCSTMKLGNCIQFQDTGLQYAMVRTVCMAWRYEQF